MKKMTTTNVLSRSQKSNSKSKMEVDTNEGPSTLAVVSQYEGVVNCSIKITYWV